ncbi:tRNA (guanine37-N1)-methyltransferase [Nocardioides marinisabuli]|uniref:tRNA (guanine-N(1)-)-methyltransferase n=1 Tax=Nocardioides marinisabuli TaxID=419476 RepID=A0A7Y9F2A7_9ACTN|nr:tRNA (guanine37-N1)-methyltransferase [Nocardioides marinisabuli]
MRLDYLTIFPDYLAPLGLSLPGKAAARGLVEVHVHDLRGWTRDRHRTVDDTPYGGGAGMVMRPEPWGEALDELLGQDPHPATVVVPSPAGRPLTQALARALSTRPRLLFACGRYEGIDQRVLDHAREREDAEEVVEVSLGDYVLNGGEVAALAVTEAVVRLLPGFMGNAASLEEESHEQGLLEYPVYTKPSSWRGHDVPPVLLSGNHAAIAAWRHEQSLARTAERRPDLLHASHVAGEWEVLPAAPGDVAELHVLTLACWVGEALLNDDLTIPPLHESTADTAASLAEWDTYVVRVAGRLVGSVRGRLDGTTWEIGRLMVAPDLQGRGLGRVLLEHAERVAAPSATTYRLVTGKDSEANLRRYKRAGYRVREVLDGPSGPAVLTKARRRTGRG